MEFLSANLIPILIVCAGILASMLAYCHLFSK